ncbi:hypothetical protein FD675_22350, partial [Escherichia coli]|nr:hypothetical protein [Escherichia coli]EFD0389979.1 hypothetical protein [Escherichia coli]
MRRQRALTPIITLPKFMELLDRTLMHCSIINSLFTMPFYNNESGIIFLNFIFLLVFLVKLSIIHCSIILRMMEIE